MHNPNKIHSVEMTTIQKEGLKTPLPIKATIFQQLDGAPDKVKELYKIEPVEGRAESVTDAFQVQVFIPEHQRDKNVPMHFRTIIKDLPEYVEKLKRRFTYGRYMLSSKWFTLPNAKSLRLKYGDLKRLLNYEKRASRFLSEKHEAVKLAKPNVLLPGAILDLDRYVVETWMIGMDRNYYTCITFDDKIFEICKLMYRVK